jgi:DNA replication ATP-dependent helicase Dna2
MIVGFNISSKRSKSPCIVSSEADDSVKAVFVDTDKVPALDSRVGDLVQNETEGELVHQLATALTSCGVNEEDIAVITPYRQQIKLLSNKFGSMPGIEILTADKSQGRDKDCIIISLVRSNDLGNVSSLTGTRIS